MRKLIRDKIPVNDGGRVIVNNLAEIDPEKYRLYLGQKLYEEAWELECALISQDSEETIDELADLFEVLRTIAYLSGNIMADVINHADMKYTQRGGFANGRLYERES